MFATQVSKIKRGSSKIKLEITSIDNPQDIHEELDENVKINISKENFSIVENIDLGGELIIRHKNVSGEIVFKKLDDF